MGRPISDLSDMFNPYALSGHHLEVVENEQGKSEGFDSCDRPSTLTQIGF